MTTDVKIDVSGEMAPIIEPSPKQPLSRLCPFDLHKFERKQSEFCSFLTIPTHLPDPKEFVLQQRQNIRPWLQFLQTTNFKTPPSLARLSKRIVRNIEYFQANYLFVFLGLIVYCLVTSPLVLLAVVASLYIGYRLNKRHTVKRFYLYGKELSVAQLYGLVTLCSMPVFYLVGAHAAMFWVLGVSFFLITLHASFYNIDIILNQNDQLLEQI